MSTSRKAMGLCHPRPGHWASEDRVKEWEEARRRGQELETVIRALRPTHPRHYYVDGTAETRHGRPHPVVYVMAKKEHLKEVRKFIRSQGWITEAVRKAGAELVFREWLQ